MALSCENTSRSWGLAALQPSRAPPPQGCPSVASSGFGGPSGGPGQLWSRETVQVYFTLEIPGLAIAKALTEREGLFRGGFSPRLGGSVSRH